MNKTLNTEAQRHGGIVNSQLRSCFEFLQKVFLGLMYPFSWVLFAPVLRQIARYLPHHRSENASKIHPKSSHDKFKTASKKTLCLRVSVFHFIFSQTNHKFPLW